MPTALLEVTMEPLLLLQLLASAASSAAGPRGLAWWVGVGGHCGSGEELPMGKPPTELRVPAGPCTRLSSRCSRGDMYLAPGAASSGAGGG